ncbi:MAG: hypothetical protein M3297_00270 [Thermoproteota archaeon]|nr:hypothetical protein [Thermoproteota archaeon]
MIKPYLTAVMVGVLALFYASNMINPIQAETGKGTDVFKVILTVFGVDKSKGDIITIVTVNNGEASKVKLLDTDRVLLAAAETTTTAAETTTTTTALSSNPRTLAASNAEPAAGSGIIEYVATFPNIQVNAGDEYEACVVTTKDLQPICTTGINSPASRPEFVDLYLDAATEIDQAIEQDVNDGETGEED